MEIIIGALVIFIGVRITYLLMSNKSNQLAYLPDEFVVFDLETTGLDPLRDEIIEIAAIRVKRGEKNQQTLQALVIPTKPIPRKITQITGITQEMVDRDGEQLDQVLLEFAEFFGDLRLVAYNAQFDMGFLHAATVKHGMKPLINPVSCALKMARKAWPDRESYSLVSIAEDGKLDSEGTHRALGDCKRALTVYAAAATKLKSYF